LFKDYSPKFKKSEEIEGMKNKRNEKTDFGDTKCPYCEGQIWSIWKGEKIKCPWCGKEFISSSIIPLNCPDELYHQRFLEISNKVKE